jgi:magnesium-transporting ATPase (P-type)
MTMLTGDQAGTAYEIGRLLRLNNVSRGLPAAAAVGYGSIVAQGEPIASMFWLSFSR